MKNRYLLWSMLIALATLAGTAFVFGSLPARVPTHWDAHGAVNAYGPRSWVFFHAGFILFFVALWALLPRVSPKRFSVDTFEATYGQVGLLVVLFLCYLQGVILWGAAHGAMDMGRALAGGMNVFSILLGNVIGKVRRNFWLGIRTPWTLASERVWYATHRMAGKTMVGAGVLGLVALLVGLPEILAIVLFMAGLLLPALYSLLYYKRLERSGGLEA